MFNPKSYENSRPDGVSVLEIVDESNSEVQQPRRFVPLQRTELRGEIAGPLASLRLTQVYRYSSEQCGKVLEAVYRFPLPGDAAVVGVRARFGDVEIGARLQERTKAESEYQESKQRGDQAALLTRETPDVFTLQVAGIRPDQDVAIETSYVQLARAEGAGWSLRVPLTTSPRYVRGDEAGSRHSHGQPLMVMRDPGHRFALDLTLSAAAEVKSPTHAVTQATEDGRVRLRLEAGEVIPDRDCVLNWRPLQEQERPTFHVTTYDDQASGHVYFLGLLAPPARKGGPGISREIILLVDHSGSMTGPKWEAADWAVKRFLGELTERDTFALGVFHDTTTWFSKIPHRADAKAVAKAIAFLESRKDNGGTELGVALEQALSRDRSAGEMARHVLIITDAEVSDAGRILRLADQEAGEALRRRIDVLCIDAAPNSFLASELAERGGGVAKFLTSAPEEEDIATALDEVLADWTQPVVTGLRLEANRERIEAAGRAVVGKAIDLGDLPAGRSIWVAGRVPRMATQHQNSDLPGSNPGELNFRVLTPNNREVGSCRVVVNSNAGTLLALKPLFGARRVMGLEYLITAGYERKELKEQLARLGYDPDVALADHPDKKSKVYAENSRDEAGRLLNRLLVREALHYGLACSETAFVAVRNEAGKPVEGTVVVANALPSGWSNAFAGGGGGGTALCMSAPVACLYDMDATLADFDPEEAPVAQSARALFKRKVSAPIRSMASALFGSYASPASAPAPDVDEERALFAGAPVFSNGEAILFDSTRDENANQLPDDTTLLRLHVVFPDGAPDADGLDPDLAVLVFVDDMAAPRARVRLSDLVRQGGVRPLNLSRRHGERVRIVLADSSGAWAASAPRLQISVQCS